MADSLEQLFQTSFNAYKALRAKMEAQAKRWEYTDGPIYEWTPLYRERNRFLRGRKVLLKRNADWHYAFDSDNRLIIARRMRPGEFEEEVFFDHQGDLVQATCFRFGLFTGAFEQRFEKGLQVGYEFLPAYLDEAAYRRISSQGYDYSLLSARDFTAGVRTSEKFQWQDGRLVSVWSRHPDHDAIVESTEHLEYDQAGHLCAIRFVDGGGVSRHVIYRLPNGITLESLGQQIRRRLVPAIVSRVEAAAISEPVYCLALSYCYEGESILPPELGLGLESERQRWLEEGDPDSIWSAVEFKNFCQPHLQFFQDQDIADLCAPFNQVLYSKEATAPARKLLNQIACDLAAVNWAGKLPITEDFVVFATDVDGEETTGNMKQSVPPVLLKKFKKAGWL